MKYCYVCGCEIANGVLHYNIGANSYICSNNQCFHFYFWDDLATKMISDKNHEYVIVDRKVYQIGSNKNEPLGFGGKIWSIQFNDGRNIETNSLWFKGDLPERLQHDFPDNAKFMTY